MIATKAEKQQFAERLKAAAGRRQKSLVSPTALSNAFNLKWDGAPVTPQAAQKWLNGSSIPTPEKMKVLATLLRVPFDWLRYGMPSQQGQEQKMGRVAAEASPISTPKPDSLTYDELRLVARLRSLPEQRRELVQTLVADLALAREMWG